MSSLEHEEVMDLLAAHALDAVDGAEAAAIEAHAASCARCKSELAGFREAISLVANDGGDAPARLWQAISAQIGRPPAGEERPDLRRLFDADKTAASSSASRRRTWRIRSWATGAVAAALVVIAALSIQLSRLDHQVAQLQTAGNQQVITQAAQSALTDPQAKRVVLDAAHSSGPAVVEIAILPSGTAFFVNRSLPALARTETYQLWGEVGDQLISLGVLGAAPRYVAFHVDPAASIEAFAVTAERAGGVVQSAHVPVAVSRTGA
jgi:anti-sigma factor RsiW